MDIKPLLEYGPEVGAVAAGIVAIAVFLKNYGKTIFFAMRGIVSLSRSLGENAQEIKKLSYHEKLKALDDKGKQVLISDWCVKRKEECDRKFRDLIESIEKRKDKLNDVMTLQTKGIDERLTTNLGIINDVKVQLNILVELSKSNLNAIEERMDKSDERFIELDKYILSAKHGLQTLEQTIKTLGDWETTWSILAQHILRNDPSIILPKKSMDVIRGNR